MKEKAEQLLRALVEAHADIRWPALYVFAIEAHRAGEALSGASLTEHLLDEGFSDAEQLGAEFDRYRELLTLYDRLRA
jgi:hypothetical protein